MNNHMIFDALPSPIEPLRAAVRKRYLADEAVAIHELLDEIRFSPSEREQIEARARQLTLGMRKNRAMGIEGFLQEYNLGSEEGIVLMCIAEALLRIPDPATADRLIHDKLASADWSRHLGHSASLLVNASTWGLMLSGKLVHMEANAGGVLSQLEKLVSRVGESVVRVALKHAMAILGHQFVAGRSIEEAILRSRESTSRLYRYSFDMLGEAALTAADAASYLAAYCRAITVIGKEWEGTRTGWEAPGISVKLSALHPRFEFAQSERLAAELVPRVRCLAEAARDAGIGLTLDAEESERLEPLLDVFAAVYRELHHFEGFGLAVQAYQKRATAVVEWLIELGRAGRRRIPVRLVKGAYWDGEIKSAQERALAGYPVFTRKSATDVSYLACARRMALAPDAIFSQFATHNAHTVAAVMHIMGERGDYEFQRLHGMGEALYAGIVAVPHGENAKPIACRVYAPVGSHDKLLPYLVRRLLENGANTSFLRHALGEIPIDTLVADPVEKMRNSEFTLHQRIPLPENLCVGRRSCVGANLHDVDNLVPLMREMEAVLDSLHMAAPIISGVTQQGLASPVIDPSDSRRVIGTVFAADVGMLGKMFGAAERAQLSWDAVPVERRAAIVERAAELIEMERGRLMVLLIREGGKCIADAQAELREAADYCRYYAHLARTTMACPLVLPGPTGEYNELRWHGRGVFACISPWNFPLAILMGQVVAALVSGNAVIAKPATRTPLIADAAIRLLHRAGVPPEVLHFLPGSSGTLSASLLADSRLAGVVVTGATGTAQAIYQRLSARGGSIVPLIAETGGVNAMIVDSSALPEQAAIDAVRSAFNSAGQRCSALRVLFLQKEIAQQVECLLTGAMEELVVGDPALLSTDVGPVIDSVAQAALEEHAVQMKKDGRLLGSARRVPTSPHGSYFAPLAFEIGNPHLINREVFGPVLHIVRYSGGWLKNVIDAINGTGYGLTLGIHSRIDETVKYIRERARVGNIYVNRSQIGAVVGVQPFGGERLSGTGPKAGGPHYLQRFALERTLSINTAALGGNAALLGSIED